MSYPIPSKTWQRVSILTLLLLIPTVGIAVLNQSLTKAIPTNSTISANSILPNHPNYQALQALVNNYSCVASVPNFATLPVTRTEFATVLNSCSQRINELIANNPTTVAPADLQTLQRLEKEFAPELAILNNPQDADKLEARGNIAPTQPTRERIQDQSIRKPSGVVIAPPLNFPASSSVINQSLDGRSSPKRTVGGGVRGMVAPEPQTGGKFNTENYNRIDDNPFHRVGNDPLSTFSIDVDTAAYSNMRRFITQGQLPPKDAVRIEEFINYFTYSYPQPTGNRPFSVTTEVTAAPWNPQHKLVQVGLQGKRLESETLPPSNLVFLIDVSGSMGEADKLPLVQQSLKLLVNKLRSEDRVSLVVYAGNAGVVLPATPGNQKTKILAAIDRLQAGGSTAGGQGIELAYKIAKQNFLKSGNNRVILATDGDFNVGVSSDAELTRLIEQKRDQGIFLTVLGFGTGNYKDGKMEQLADKGNGNYAQDSTSQLITQTIKDSEFNANQTPSTNLRFAAAIATFGMILRDSEYKGNANYDLVMKLATQGQGEDQEGYRGEFIRLVEQSRELMTRK
jgi:Ca-activated chloride channel family protein